MSTIGVQPPGTGGRAGAPRTGRGLLAKKRLALAAILLVGLSYATMIQSFSWNQTSHYDLIRSLNQDKTTIDQYQTNTGDKAEYKGHWYSARAPGLAVGGRRPEGSWLAPSARCSSSV